MKKSLALSVTEGFTLLEMLVVLGVIAVILSVMTVSYSVVQKKARDAKRKQDLKAIQSGLEQYYTTCVYVYPTGLPTGIPLACGASPAVITSVPKDPKTGAGYTYTPASGGFSICTTLESDSSSYCLQNQL